MKLCIKTTSQNAGISPELVRICGKYTGDTPICFYIEDMGKTVMPKNKLTLGISRESINELKKLYSPKNIGLIR